MEMELSIASEMENISNLQDPPEPEVEMGDFLFAKSPSPLPPAAEDNQDIGADESDNDNMVIAEEKSDDDDDDRNISFRSKKKTRCIASDDEYSNSSHKSPEKSRSPSPSSPSPPSDVDDSADDEQLLDIPPTTYGKSSSKNRRQVSSPSPSSPIQSQERSTFSLKTLDPDVYGDDSEEEVRSLHSYHGGNSSDSDRHRSRSENEDNENENNNKKTKKKRKEPLPKRKASEKARETMMKELASKTQKMVRESRIELPYHKPKQLTLDEFLKRRNRARAPLLESLVQAGENLGCGARNGISMEEDVLPMLAEVEKDDEEIRRNQELADMLKAEPVVIVETLPMSPLGDDVEMEVNDDEKQVIPSEDHHQKGDGEDLVSATIVTEEKDDDNDAKKTPPPIDNDDLIMDEVKQLTEEGPVITVAQDDAIDMDKKTEDVDNLPTINEPLTVVEPENQTVIPSSPIKNQEDAATTTPNITTTLEDPTSTFTEGEAALNAFLSENKPKPKKLTIKEMIMNMPGYDKIAQMKPVIGGARKGFRVNPNEIIDLRDDIDKNKPNKNAKAMDTLISRFAKHACAGVSSNAEDSRPQHYKLHVNKIEKDSQGILHSVVDDIDYVSTPVEDDLDIITKITRTTGSSPREQVPGEKMFRLKKALKDSIRAKKAKEYEERTKLHSMYNGELEFKDDLPDDEIILDDEEDEAGVSSEEDEEDEEELDEEEEEDVEVATGAKKKRKRLLYVDDEAEDEDGDQMSSSDDDDINDIDGDDEGDDELEDVENSQSQSSKVKNSEDTTDFKSQIPKTVLSDLASQSQTVDQIGQLLSKTGNEIDAKDLDLSSLCSGRFPSQAPLTPIESQVQDCFGFDDDDDEELGNMSLTSYTTTPGTGASNINNDTSIMSDPIVGDAEEPEIDLNKSKSATEKKSDETPKRNHSIYEEEEQNVSDNDDIVQLPKKIKPKRLHFSDDEEENDGKKENEALAVSSHDENESNDVPDEIPNYDDEDDEEAEFERQLIRQKEQQKAKPKGLFGANGLLRKKFVEHEAELSGSDEGSGDEDEQGLNFYEQEDGDEDDLDEDAVRSEIERAHLKHLLDKDDMEIRDLQYEFLEKGDLEDGKQRERKFRWTDVDAAWGDDHAMMGDFDGDGVGEEETEEDAKQRIAEIERRKWINDNSQMLEATEEESQRTMFENSKFLKLGRTTKKKIESFVENSSSSFMMMNESSNSVQQDVSFSALIKSKITGNPHSFLSASKLTNDTPKDEEDSVKLSSKSQPMFASPDDPCSKIKRGSFLSRGSPSLTRLAEITKLNVPKANDVTSNVKNNSRNFVFSVITPPDQASKQNNKAAKRPAHSQGAQPKKFVKMDRSFSNMDDSSKDASIFKWF